MKRVLAVLLSAVLSLSVAVVPGIQTLAEEPDAAQKTEGQQEAEVEVQAPSAVLMEASTGAVLYEKDADTRRAPASVTKIMTMLLIFDALEDGKIALEDEVSTSEYAASMGGSQVFLEPGETQSVDTMLKCISVASANDACTAMAEYIAGSEEAFVKMMNERAAGLGMANTHFVDCCGLTEDPAHLTTARDIALMSRELITRYPQIHNYSTIWMDTITHVTKQGTKEFGLSNTNRLLKMPAGYRVTGLKTGSTSLAKYCLSATAEKDGIRLIAAVMAAPDYKARFADAQTLLNYGYASCRLYEDQEMPELPLMAVADGIEDFVPLSYQGKFSYLSLNGEDFSQVEKKSHGLMQRFGSLEVAMRQNDLAWEVQNYLADHPDAAVVNLGCGLDGTGRACDNGSCKIYNLDFPDVIAVRNQLLPAGDREENIPCNLNDTEWFTKIDASEGAIFFASGVFYYFLTEQVRTLVQAMADSFPGGVLVFDAANRTAVKMIAKTWLRSAKIQDVGAYFAVSDAKSEISPWDSRLQVTSRGYMLGYNDLRDPSVSGLFRFLARTGDRIMKMQIVRICFGQR